MTYTHMPGINAYVEK